MFPDRHFAVGMLYRAKEADDGMLRQKLRELAALRKRFGSPRLHVMLKRRGW